MSEQHRQALSQGRIESKAIKDYLDAINTSRRRGGSESQLRDRLNRVEAKLAVETNNLTRLQLNQKKREIKEKMAASSHEVDFGALERRFVSVAASYSRRKKIGYGAWRDLGVSPSVLKAAGIRR